MLNRFKNILLFSIFSLLIINPIFGDWDYYGSGRDHPISAYIDRYYYVGPADYKPIEGEYINGPLVITQVPAPVIMPAPLPVAVQPAEFVVNIPNAHGGYNAVVIKRFREGYLGPNGEYYPEFPKVFQLQMKYGN